MERLLIINPGSTSTKIAVYENEEQVFLENISHSTEELSQFSGIGEQYDFRKAFVLNVLKDRGYQIEGFSAIVGRGGLLPKIKAGVYEVNEDMVWQLRFAPTHNHASNLGALIAYAIGKPLGIPAYICDAVGADEMPELNKITGLKGIEREGVGHNLNMRATAIRYAKEHDKDYKDITVVVAHLGGGMSISLHHNGRIVDMINDDDGGFTPERAGAVPMTAFIRKIFKENLSEQSAIKLLKTKGGLTSHLGVNDVRKVQDMIAAGDDYAKLVYEAMALQIARNVAREFPIVNGKVEAILLTGGIAYSEVFTGMLKERLEFLAPVILYPGENEMEALALGGLRALSGEAIPQTYSKVEN